MICGYEVNFDFLLDCKNEIIKICDKYLEKHKKFKNQTLKKKMKSKIE